MILYPAIDLKAGACVRLVRGDMDQATTFNPDPADQASRFAQMGFEWLHVVDLDGAFVGKSANAEAVAAILKATPCPVQLGGGVRDMAGVERWLDAGVRRVILGTAAVRDPDFVRNAARTFEGQIAVGIDARDGYVAVQGWAETTDMQALDLARVFEGVGVAALIVTDISRDGMKSGVNIALTGAMADAVSIPVIASGGLKDISDIRALRDRNGVRGVSGAILGRALYDGDIRAEDALRAAA